MLTEPACTKTCYDKSQIWTDLNTFDSKEEAEKFLKATEKWHIKKKYSTKNGDKHIYKCSVLKCKAQKILWFHCDSQKITVQSNEVEHSHSLAESGKLTSEVKKIMESLILLKLKPKDIRKRLQEKNHSISIKQISNFAFRLKTKTHGSEPFSYEKLERWCQDKSIVQLESSIDSSFVAGSVVNIKTETFRLLITTRRLLQLGSEAKMIHTDVTYKVKWHGFPAFIIGFADAACTFHPYRLALYSGETTNDYEFILSAF
jgi:hypothetical protein